MSLGAAMSAVALLSLPLLSPVPASAEYLKKVFADYCPANLTCPTPACSPDGRCLYEDAACSAACQCRCTPDGRTPDWVNATCRSGASAGCHDRDAVSCTPTSVCVHHALGCHKRCHRDCICSLPTAPAHCAHRCPSGLNCNCIGCSEDGRCEFGDKQCDEQCTCGCTLAHPVLCNAIRCPSELDCTCIGCTQTGVCIFDDPRCGERCLCGCSLALPAKCSPDCPGHPECWCIGCTQAGDCLYDDPRCKDVCSCSCKA